MDASASNYPGANLLLKYMHGDITAEELALLYKYIEDSPVLKERFEELTDPEIEGDRFRYQFNIDNESDWQKFKSKYLTDPAPVTVPKINLFKILGKSLKKMLTWIFY